MTNLLKILPLIFAFLLSSCGHGDTFRVEGKLEGKETMNIRIVYFSDGSVHTGVTASQEGTFRYEAPASSQAMVEIYDNDYRILGRFIADPGDDISVTFNRQNPYLIKAKGNQTSEEWAKFLNENAETLPRADKATRNRIIADFVKANTANPLSELLMATEFDASGAAAVEAAQLMEAIDDQAKASGFSVGFAEMVAQSGKMAADAVVPSIPYQKRGGQAMTFSPADNELSLLVFTDQTNGRDSVVKTLKSLGRHLEKGKFQIVDLVAAPDTFALRRSVINDSASWAQGWLPGSIAARGVDKLGIPTMPYMIVVDRKGKQLWRGSSVANAKSEVITRLAK